MKRISYQVSTSYNELYLFNRGNFQNGKRERGKSDNFCVINVKYKEISWRVRKEEKDKEEEKSNF